MIRYVVIWSRTPHADMGSRGLLNMGFPGRQRQRNFTKREPNVMATVSPRLSARCVRPPGHLLAAPKPNT